MLPYIFSNPNPSLSLPRKVPLGHDSFFRDPPPYFLSSPIEMFDFRSSTTSSSLTPPEEMERDDDATKSSLERFSPEEEQRLLAAAALQKASGNTLFATHHYLAAIDAYTLALSSTPSYLDHETSILHSNLAACHLKLSAPTLALSHATDAISRRPGWRKPMLRRCRAREMLGTWKELEEAVGEYQALLKEEGLGEAERRECCRGLERCRGLLEEAREREVGEAVRGLRKLGDGLLKPFGISTGDFGMKPDGKGGYSLQFRGGG